LTPLNQSWCFGWGTIHTPLPEFKPWDHPTHILVRRNTALFSSGNLKVRILITYFYNGNCDHS
jgi:hypothetical protein